MQRINVKFVPALTPMQAQNKGFVYDYLNPILSLKLVEWGDRLRVLSTDEPATFKQTIDLSTRPSKIGAIVQTIIDQFGKVE